jgi:hypothetical protein
MDDEYSVWLTQLRHEHESVTVVLSVCIRRPSVKDCNTVARIC